MINNQKNFFTHFKIHTQYSICEGALKIEELKNFCKKNKIRSIGISDTANLSGALEFSENISKQGTQPIIGTQIVFDYEGCKGLLTLIAKNDFGYKKLIELSSKSYLENYKIHDAHCKFEELLKIKDGVILMTGSINGLFGKLFYKGRLKEIEKSYEILKRHFLDNFYIEIQRHDDLNEKNFEIFNLNLSYKLDVPIIASHEVYYLYQDLYAAHDALMCIGSKDYINNKNRLKLSRNHYLKNDNEMRQLFFDLPVQ